MNLYPLIALVVCLGVAFRQWIMGHGVEDPLLLSSLFMAAGSLIIFIVWPVRSSQTASKRLISIMKGLRGCLLLGSGVAGAIAAFSLFTMAQSQITGWKIANEEAFGLRALFCTFGGLLGVLAYCQIGDFLRKQEDREAENQ